MRDIIKLAPPLWLACQTLFPLSSNSHKKWRLADQLRAHGKAHAIVHTRTRCIGFFPRKLPSQNDAVNAVLMNDAVNDVHVRVLYFVAPLHQRYKLGWCVECGRATPVDRETCWVHPAGK